MNMNKIRNSNIFWKLSRWPRYRIVPRAEGGSHRAPEYKFNHIMKLLLMQLWSPTTHSKALFMPPHRTTVQGSKKGKLFYFSIVSQITFTRTISPMPSTNQATQIMNWWSHIGDHTGQTTGFTYPYPWWPIFEYSICDRKPNEYALAHFSCSAFAAFLGSAIF